MNNNLKRIIIFFSLILAFIMIFGFSNQNGNDSGNLSKKVTIFLVSMFNFKDINAENIVFIEYIVRKTAHFSIYTVVGVLLILLLKTYNLTNFKRMLYSLFIGLLYAILDEIHQSFIPDRSPQVIDVMIDTLGVLFGICIIILITKFIKNCSKNEIREATKDV